MPLLSVVIATRDRSGMLPRVFKSLLDQKLDKDLEFEVLLADNNSTDPTRQVVESFMPQFKNRLCYLLEPQQGKSFAVNRAIRESKGDILVFTDDDVVADPLWLQNIVDCFRQYDCDGLGGRILAEYTPRTPDWVRDNADILAGPIVFYDLGKENKPYTKPMYEFLGANFAFKRTLFEQLGYFKTNIGPGQGTLGEDTELVNRFLKGGKKLYYCGKALVWHPVEDSRSSLKYIGAWNVGLGRYRFITDEQGKIDPSLVYYFGMPRYLLFKMFSDALKLMVNVFNKRKFLVLWIDLHRNGGKLTEIRKVYFKKNA
jgi:glycosyltransferase involved in cell wall biosynthesis